MYRKKKLCTCRGAGAPAAFRGPFGAPLRPARVMRNTPAARVALSATRLPAPVALRATDA